MVLRNLFKHYIHDMTECLNSTLWSRASMAIFYVHFERRLIEAPFAYAAQLRTDTSMRIASSARPPMY